LSGSWMGHLRCVLGWLIRDRDPPGPTPRRGVSPSACDRHLPAPVPGPVVDLALLDPGQCVVLATGPVLHLPADRRGHRPHDPLTGLHRLAQFLRGHPPSPFAVATVSHRLHLHNYGWRDMNTTSGSPGVQLGTRSVSTNPNRL